MSRLAPLSISLLLFLIALPLISIGTTRGPPILWWLGLIALGVGGLIPPAQRFLTPGEPRQRHAGAPDSDRASSGREGAR